MSDGPDSIHHPIRDPARVLERWRGTAVRDASAAPQDPSRWESPRTFKLGRSGATFCAPIAALILWPALTFPEFVGVWAAADALSWLWRSGRVTIDPVRREVTLAYRVQLGRRRTWGFDEIARAKARPGMISEDEVRLRRRCARLRIRTPKGAAKPIVAAIAEP